MNELSIESFEAYMAKNLTVIDTRPMEQVKTAFIKGSILFSFEDRLSDLTRYFLKSDSALGSSEILLVCDENEKLQWISAVEKVGIKIKGLLKGGFKAWENAGKPIDLIIDVEADELMMDIPFDANLVVLDVRSAMNFANGHLKDAVSIPLNNLNDPLRMAAIEDMDNLYIIGNNDKEVYLAASVLKKQDIHNIHVVLGGWEAVVAQPSAKVVKAPEMLN
ncbi:MAG: rhodanese-like domain-containing protein [Niabella sp.]|nr:MAG: rhodanese-like domain-containing protein [Niabella sp.]